VDLVQEPEDHTQCLETRYFVSSRLSREFSLPPSFFSTFGSSPLVRISTLFLNAGEEQMGKLGQ